ncbi:MAG: hypothetical protein E6H03_04305 [Bacillati bacterium ANGP1]|uniref:Uncharacterized protein n=1 Tax=Candidatus Segetimicrobium genomatis TaxID=2569760 RepID=A0A537JHV1_9BACT|nr:MAG: hypothetical protein E6H03_04305 [Terrabacteria group bacterium ANGP1]
MFEHAFMLAAPGEAWAALTLDAPGTSWRRGEAAVVSVDVDGGARQEVILANGDESTEYLRALGRLPAGPHTLRLRIPQDLPLSAGRVVTVGSVRTGCVDDSDPAASVWRHAPVIHYRALNGPLDSLTSDAPLVLFYRLEPRAGGAALEYHLIYSHEDATLDPGGRVIGEEFQGPAHATLRFGGGRSMGGHPVLQVATLNGTVTDVVRCPYRAALAPATAQPEGEPREGVLQRYPWIYRVSALEVLRQVPLEADPSPASEAAADLRSYVFLQWKRLPGPAPGTNLPLEAGVRVRDVWYTSAWGSPDLAFAEPDAESTTVKVPAGTTEADVTGIALRAFDPPAEPADVRLVRAFFLDGEYRPRPPFAGGAACRLTRREPRRVVWERP